jgi:ubiquitin-conjugating enzyme E2 variant
MLCLLQIILGWFVADLLSGIYHYVVDNFGTPDTPILGKQIKDFQLHHINPEDFLKDTAWSSIQLPLLATIPMLIAAYFVWPCFFISLGIGLGLSQYFHRCAHEPNPNPNPVKRILQRAFIMLPPQEHDRHHSGFKDAYGIVNGWANPLLDFVFKHAPKRKNTAWIEKLEAEFKK